MMTVITEQRGVADGGDGLQIWTGSCEYIQ